MFGKLILILFMIHVSYTSSSQNDSFSTPIVIWHGLGDSCCKANGIGRLIKDIESVIPEVYTLSIKIGQTEIEDTSNSLLLHPDQQVSKACSIISSDPKLEDGFHAVGISQGAQFLRALIQRCPGAKVKNLVSLGGQHQGIYGVPKCQKWLPFICGFINKIINTATSFSVIQSLFVPFSYWHNALDEASYIKHNTFLADINNEREIKQVYVERLTSINNFVMVRYEKDEMVIPIESSWFGFYRPGQDKEILRLNESRIYLEDRLGLNKMDSEDKLHFLSVAGKHIQHGRDWFKENIIKKFLAPRNISKPYVLH